MEAKQQKKATNHSMYKEMRKRYKQLLKSKTILDYNTINGVFGLEERSQVELANLQEYIVTATVMSGQDALKAKVRSNTRQEQLKLKEHKERCDLMMLLTEAIGSVMYTNYGL